MRFGNQVIQQLARNLAGIKSDDSHGPANVQLSVGEIKVTFDIADFDKFSYYVRRLTLEATKPDAVSFSEAHDRAGKMAARISYLPERLTVIEEDKHSHQIQIRSAKPHKDDNGTSFFEAIISLPARVSFSRRAYDGDTGMTSDTPFPFTAEVLARLLDDLRLVCV